MARNEKRAERRRVLAAFYELVSDAGVGWWNSVERWHAVESITALPTETLQALVDGTHPIWAVVPPSRGYGPPNFDRIPR